MVRDTAKSQADSSTSAAAAHSYSTSGIAHPAPQEQSVASGPFPLASGEAIITLSAEAGTK